MEVVRQFVLNKTTHGLQRSRLEHVAKLLPTLTEDLRKGSLGKIAVIGGSIEYTGAPYFSALSLLKLGADLVHIFCATEAAPVIKTYSPDFIVHPGMEPDQVIQVIAVQKLERIDAIVIGPGLGRDPTRKTLVQRVTEFAKAKDLPYVIDGDGLWFVAEDIGSLPPLPKAILTPNVVEFSRLCEKALGRKDVLEIKDEAEITTLGKELAAKLQCSLFIKGKRDIIVNPDGSASVGNEQGSLRRCGGQGDTTSGTMAVLLLWALRQEKDVSIAKTSAALACSQLIRAAAREAYAQRGRSMTTSDLLHELGPIVKAVDEGTWRGGAQPEAKTKI